MEERIKRIAIIETKPSKTNFSKEFNNAFEYSRFSLCSDPTIQKVLKKHVDIDINIDEYDWIILVGADATKLYTGQSVTDYTGRVLDNKFIPVINPAMITFKPEAKKVWEESRDRIIGFISGSKKVITYNTDKIYGITDSAILHEFLRNAIASPNTFFGIDSETTSLYPRNGYVLGVSVSYERDHGAYIDANCIDEEAEELFKELFRKKKAILHNAKFDLAFFKYHFDWDIVDYEDTMLLHYCINELPGTHSLKKLAIEYTDYGGYEDELDDFKADYCKKYGILKDNFTYDLIPFEVMYKYAAIDSIVTFLIYCRLKPAVSKNTQLNSIYTNILLPASTFLQWVENNGVPFDLPRLRFAQGKMQEGIDEAIAGLYKDSRIKEFENFQEKEFNPNSVMQLRSLLFDYLKIPPTGKKTDTGSDSTSAEVLQELAEEHEIPQLILNIRQKSKIKNTYLDKIIPQLDKDSRLRTGFNIHGTTSGRLSSSGKLNLQQLPRDEPGVKGAIKARPGYKIVSVDLTTAEVYIAAVLSGDKKLQRVFTSKSDFHSTIAKQVFNLACSVEEVKDKYPLFRQAAKAITFGINIFAQKY